MAERISAAFQNAVDEGHRRLTRTTPSLLATGAVGGIDLSLGLFAYLSVKHGTGDEVLASLAFSIGFIALMLARSELFTENFLVPLYAVATGRERMPKVFRLWGGTALSNLAGGWVAAVVIVNSRPDVSDTAVELAQRSIDKGIGIESFFAAVMGGVIITLMTWMERSSPTLGGQLVAAIVTGFLLMHSEVLHSIVASLELFVALLFGAPFGYADWAGMFAWAVFGNVIGGVGLVSGLRLVQVGPRALREERRRSAARDDSELEPEDAPGGRAAVEQQKHADDADPEQRERRREQVDDPSDETARDDGDGQRPDG